MKKFISACVAVLAFGVLGDAFVSVTNDATALYEKMLRQPTGETLMDVEMACRGGTWNRTTVALLAKELAAEKRDIRFEDELTDSHSLAAYFLSVMIDLEWQLPEGAEQPSCLIRSRLVPDEADRDFQLPHRIHVFRLTESGRRFALEKAEAYLQSGAAKDEDVAKPVELPPQKHAGTNVTDILRLAIRQLQKIGRTGAITPESAPKSYYGRHVAGRPMLDARCNDVNGRFKYRCSYSMSPVPECMWLEVRMRRLGDLRTYADFDREPAWNLLEKAPAEYSFEDVLAALGKPYRSRMLDCRSCGAKDMRWEYSLVGLDDNGEAIHHTLTFSFAANGRCRWWMWCAE